jgi:SAM-dependent methyltransferase
MSKEAFKFTGDDAINYKHYLGPVLFEPSALTFLTHIGSPNVGSALEVSCGTGRLTKHLRTYFPASTKFIASDVSGDMIAVAKEKLKDASIEFKIADAQQLPFPDNSFDLVLCQHGIMFFPDKLKGFEEAFRVLKPGGRFIFATWDSTKNMPLFNVILEEVVIPFFKGEEESRFRIPFSLHEPDLLFGFLSKAGFINNTISPVEFKSGNASYKEVINGLFLKHPLSRQVAAKNPAAVAPMTEEMEKKLITQFGGDHTAFDLRAFIGVGKKL